MNQCWSNEPSERPTGEELLVAFYTLTDGDEWEEELKKKSPRLQTKIKRKPSNCKNKTYHHF